MDIAERRLPQDGRIELNIAGSPVDLRVSTLPTMFGESVVMRVLDRRMVALDINELGLRRDDMDMLMDLMHRPHGIILCTGPTGSGKTTTLYAALRELNDIGAKILTVEDPVEYDIQGVMQMPVRPEHRRHLRPGLRSILRQDPDIILVGEIRDKETGEMAVQASLTGHVVFSTLHTNDAATAITRLMDLGMEPFLINATLEGIVAQRLVRKICSQLQGRIRARRRTPSWRSACGRRTCAARSSTAAAAATAVTTSVTTAAWAYTRSWSSTTRSAR